ncbi:eukaryotic translation initiation factor 2-alpha kinase 1-like [Panonychus citri]|uniref:eukaryotic translation initiation factor 2-alpha kinase 1-like n=1 Tax=Panonychus citri TaxID=50023 RepID=UPI002307AFD6|nr:eukaryotic translation initiation factor 2-alpha kinase 1-like [Panonychus citri]
MTNDSDYRRSVKNDNPSDRVDSPRPLQPVLNLDVSNLDDNSSSALIAAEVPSRQSLFTLYTLLYDKVTNVQKDERKQTLVYQELCKRLRQLGFVEVLPQIDTLRSYHHKYSFHLDNLISEISLDIDQQYTSLNINIGDLFSRNSSLPKSNNLFVRLNVKQHQLLNTDPISNVSNTSRSNDFLNCGLIAKGGFGSVYKMQNLTDKCIYAIKAIPFKSRNQVDASKIMKEVYYYALLPSHQNIVSYKSSWLDHYVKDYGSPADSFNSSDGLQSTTEFLSSTDSSGSPPSKGATVSHSPSSNLKEQFNPKQDGDSLIQSQVTLSPDTLLIKSPNSPEKLSQESFSSQSTSQNENNSTSLSSSTSTSSSASSSQLPSKSQQSSSSNDLMVEFISSEHSSNQQQQLKMKPKETCDGDKLAVTTKVNTKAPLYYCVLCIQMELCSFNLRAWIDKRNDDLYHKRSESVDYDKAIDIFIQIVKGVHHLHSHNLIHRDIKPHNILFSELGVVKIGDFGLTTFNAHVEVQEDETLAWSGEVQNRTRGLGTSSYSAPEQQKTTCYNCKADIYSLGLIAFELLYPLFTDMERSDRFDKLKSKQILPEELTKCQPFADLILETVQDDPESRPDAATILDKESILRHGWKINSDQPTYEQVKEINKHLNDKLTKLEETIQAKDEEIKRLQKELEIQEIDKLSKAIDTQLKSDN